MIKYATRIRKNFNIASLIHFYAEFSINARSNRQYEWSLRKTKYLHSTSQTHFEEVLL